MTINCRSDLQAALSILFSAEVLSSSKRWNIFFHTYDLNTIYLTLLSWVSPVPSKKLGNVEVLNNNNNNWIIKIQIIIILLISIIGFQRQSLTMFQDWPWTHYYSPVLVRNSGFPGLCFQNTIVTGLDHHAMLNVIISSSIDWRAYRDIEIRFPCTKSVY